MSNQLPFRLSLNLHGVSVRVSVSDPEVLASVKFDFSRFVTEGPEEPADIHIMAFLSDVPDDPPAGRMRRWIRTKDADVYAAGGKRVLDTAGRARVVLSFSTDEAWVYCPERNLLREKIYLLIMSRVGDRLDRNGVHRIHAMGVSVAGRAVICALFEGGGKTTLTLDLMEHSHVALLSDEVTLINRSGDVLGMPIRLGVREDTTLDVPHEFISRFTRSRKEPKLLIDSACFGDRIAAGADPGILLVGSRSDSRAPKIVPASGARAFLSLWKLCVLGDGVPRLLEYVLRLHPATLAAHLRVLASRTMACIRLIRRSDCYVVELSSDRLANAALVLQLAQTRQADRAD